MKANSYLLIKGNYCYQIIFYMKRKKLFIFYVFVYVSMQSSYHFQKFTQNIIIEIQNQLYFVINAYQNSSIVETQTKSNLEEN